MSKQRDHEPRLSECSHCSGGRTTAGCQRHRKWGQPQLMGRAKGVVPPERFYQELGEFDAKPCLLLDSVFTFQSQQSLRLPHVVSRWGGIWRELRDIAKLLFTFWTHVVEHYLHTICLHTTCFYSYSIKQKHQWLWFMFHSTYFIFCRTLSSGDSDRVFIGFVVSNVGDLGRHWTAIGCPRCLSIHILNSDWRAVVIVQETPTTAAPGPEPGSSVNTGL